MSIPVLKIGKHEPRYPLIQGGMGAIVSGTNLAGHVAACGGVGTIASVGLSVNSPLFKQIGYFEANRIVMREAARQAKKIAEENRNPMIGNSKPVIAVNCMVALTDYEIQVRSSCEGGADIIISGAGLPLRLPEYTKDFPDVALLPIVSSAKAAGLVARRWEKHYSRIPDGFVVVTPHASGGHCGVSAIEQVYAPEFALDVIVPEVIDYVAEELKSDIPVVAAGGIWDRSDTDRVFRLGAKGVQMGTRFVCTEECDANIRYKQAFIDATENDIVVINSSVGLPARVIRSPFVSAYLEGRVESKPCFANCLSHCRYMKDRSTFCIAMALVEACRGNWESGLFFCGANVVKAAKMETVERIMRDLFPEGCDGR